MHFDSRDGSRGVRVSPFTCNLIRAAPWRDCPGREISVGAIGIAAQALTGRSAFLRRMSSQQWCLIVRQFPVDVSTRYEDYPHGLPRDDQVFQAWDGLGFGEMEYHSPVLDAERGPRNLCEQDQLWAFGGSAPAIAALADILLRVDIRELLRSSSASV